MSRFLLRNDAPDRSDMKPSPSSDRFSARLRNAALRRLALTASSEISPAVLNRLQVVRHFLEGKMTAKEIASRAMISRTTAFAYWHEYRVSGLTNLVKGPGVGRPCTMPAIVRQRFDYLAQIDPDGGGQALVYVAERERLVFKVLGAGFPAWKISRWLKQYVREHHLADRTFRFRTIRPALSRLPERIRERYYGYSIVNLSWKKRLLAEAVQYASDLKPEDRELCRRALAVCFDVARSEVVFSDEPNQESAKLVCAAPACVSKYSRPAAKQALCLPACAWAH